jgi:hypothetical protein
MVHGRGFGAVWTLHIGAWPCWGSVVCARGRKSRSCWGKSRSALELAGGAGAGHRGRQPSFGRAKLPHEPRYAHCVRQPAQPKTTACHGAEHCLLVAAKVQMVRPSHAKEQPQRVCDEESEARPHALLWNLCLAADCKCGFRLWRLCGNEEGWWPMSQRSSRQPVLMRRRRYRGTRAGADGRCGQGQRKHSDGGWRPAHFVRKTLPTDPQGSGFLGGRVWCYPGQNGGRVWVGRRRRRSSEGGGVWCRGLESIPFMKLTASVHQRALRPPKFAKGRCCRSAKSAKIRTFLYDVFASFSRAVDTFVHRHED